MNLLRPLLATIAIMALTATACSGSEDSTDDEASVGPKVEFTTDSVDAFVEEASGDRLDCFDVDADPAFRTCMSDNEFSAHLYVVNDDEGEVEQVYVANDSDEALPQLIGALRATLLSDLSADEFEDAIAEKNVTSFDGASVRGGDGYVVVAADDDAAAEEFPDLPGVDAAAVVAALEDNLQAQCSDSGSNQSCQAPGSETQIGEVSGEGSPVTLSAQVDVTTDNTWFENVPEYLEAAGMPLSEASKEDLAACDPEADCAQPLLVTESGLRVELMANFEMTLVEVKEFPSFD